MKKESGMWQKISKFYEIRNTSKGVNGMKRFRELAKDNRGFSLVELLIALLIMAVIAAAAITMFGGVLNTSKSSTDKETAENIKKAIVTYMNSSNDTELAALGANGTTGVSSSGILANLQKQVIISGTTTKTVQQATINTSTGAIGTPGPFTPTVTVASTVVNGTYGPFLDVNKPTAPQEKGTIGWSIVVNSTSGMVTVDSVKTGTTNLVVNN